MHDAFFAEAALPEPPAIFRVQLRPYSLGHELHLWRRGNPHLTMPIKEFDDLPYGARLAATMQAVAVCSRDYRENLRPDGGWRIFTLVARWSNLKNAIAKLRSHIAEAHTEFKSNLPAGEGFTPRFIGAPRMLSLYQFVCDTVPDREIALYSPGRHQTAWDYPMCLAGLMHQSRLERDGLLSIFNHKDKVEADYVEKMDKLEAEEIAAKAKEGKKPQRGMIPFVPAPEPMAVNGKIDPARNQS